MLEILVSFECDLLKQFICQFFPQKKINKKCNVVLMDKIRQFLLDV